MTWQLNAEPNAGDPDGIYIGPEVHHIGPQAWILVDGQLARVLVATDAGAERLASRLGLTVWRLRVDNRRVFRYRWEKQ